jgi:hypothetical protein
VLRDQLPEIARLLVVGIARLRPCGAEDGHLLHVTVGREDLERVAHLLQCGVHDLEIEAGGSVTSEQQSGRDDLSDEGAVLLGELCRRDQI